MARDYNDRYQSAAEMGNDLTQIYSTLHAEPLKTEAVNVLTASPEFKGPKLDTETVESLHQPVAGPNIEDSDAAQDPFASDTTSQFDDSEPIINFTPGPLASDVSSSDPNTKKTVTINPEIVDIASYYQAGVVGQMESVLSGSEDASLAPEDAFVHTTTNLKKMQSALVANKSIAEKIGFDYRRVFLVVFVILAIVVGIISGLLLVEVMFGSTELGSFFS